MIYAPAASNIVYKKRVNGRPQLDTGHTSDRWNTLPTTWQLEYQVIIKTFQEVRMFYKLIHTETIKME